MTAGVGMAGKGLGQAAPADRAAGNHRILRIRRQPRGIGGGAMTTAAQVRSGHLSVVAVIAIPTTADSANDSGVDRQAVGHREHRGAQGYGVMGVGVGAGADGGGALGVGSGLGLAEGDGVGVGAAGQVPPRPIQW